MTRIDFYVLPDASENQRIDMACRLAEKAWKQSQKVFIHTQDETTMRAIDDALWRFRDDAFVPHKAQSGAHPGDAEITNQAAYQEEPVEIGCDCQPQGSQTVLINLADSVPPFFSRFERTLEIVNQHADTKRSGRDRYSFYQQRGYPLNHHNIRQEQPEPA